MITSVASTTTTTTACRCCCGWFHHRYHLQRQCTLCHKCCNDETKIKSVFMWLVYHCRWFLGALLEPSHLLYQPYRYKNNGSGDQWHEYRSLILPGIDSEISGFNSIITNSFPSHGLRTSPLNPTHSGHTVICCCNIWLWRQLNCHGRCNAAISTATSSSGAIKISYSCLSSSPKEHTGGWWWWWWWWW